MLRRGLRKRGHTKPICPTGMRHTYLARSTHPAPERHENDRTRLLCCFYVQVFLWPTRPLSISPNINFHRCAPFTKITGMSNRGNEVEAMAAVSTPLYDNRYIFTSCLCCMTCFVPSGGARQRYCHCAIDAV